MTAPWPTAVRTLGLGYATSPVMHGGMVFVGHGLIYMTAGYPAKNVLAIKPSLSTEAPLEAKVEWTHARGTAYVTSPILVGDKVLQSSEDGDVFVIQAGPEHRVITTNKLGEPIYASPALSNGTIYIRGEQHLYAVR